MASKKTFVPLHVHSCLSLLDGIPSPKDIINRCIELGLPGTAITDHGNISCMKSFFDIAKKKGIKPIIGTELYITDQDPTIKTIENNKRSHLIILAKNDKGINDLMALVSETNRPDFFYRRPRINLERLAPFASEGNLICLSACIAGKLPSSLFKDFRIAMSLGGHGENLDEVRSHLRDDWKAVGAEIIKQYIDIFGEKNFYIELQDEGMSAQTVSVECLRILGKELGVPTVATIDAHYCRKEDAEDQRLLLYSRMHTTKEEQAKRIQNNQDVMDFFVSDNYYIPSYEEMRQKFTEEEIAVTLQIADQIQYSSLGHKPYLPKFALQNPNEHIDSNDFLRQQCIEGARRKLSHLSKSDKAKYWNRIQQELTVIKEAELADYFLIVWDACRFVDENNGPRGKGRGSGAGSMVNYVLDITDIDPIKYDLYFERFYNRGRNIRPHYDVGDVSFLDWYTANADNLGKMDALTARKMLSKLLAKRIKEDKILFTDDVKKEVEWIDENNEQMWLYLSDMTRQQHPENKANSYLAYAVGITSIPCQAPVKFNMGHTSLPDIDTDIGVLFREKLIQYLKDRWGHDKVLQMVTFGRLQGKAALKEVFRSNPETVQHLFKVKAVKEDKNPDDCTMSVADLCNDITRHIPDEAAIADELKECRDEFGDEYGILQWAIHNIEQVCDAYQWYKPLFDQAMRLEGTKKSQSKHAAGIVIADRPIENLVPLMYDSVSKDRIVGLEMKDAEAMGCVKFDFLGLNILDKIHFAQKLINGEASDE